MPVLVLHLQDEECNAAHIVAPYVSEFCVFGDGEWQRDDASCARQGALGSADMYSWGGLMHSVAL